MEIINPATEEVVAKVEVDTEDAIREKYGRLRVGQPKWGALGVEERIGCIERFYHLLEADKAVLAETLTVESGKPLQQSHNELNGARSRIRWMLDHAVKWVSEEWIVKEG